MPKNTKILHIAKKLRKNMTRAEELLWKEIRANKLGVKFKRQVPFVLGDYRYIVDFACVRKKFIIEIDGEYHNEKETKELDEFREEVFEFYKYRVIRFKNEEVKNNIDLVIEKIKFKIV